jgi:hypothetical protein
MFYIYIIWSVEPQLRVNALGRLTKCRFQRILWRCFLYLEKNVIFYTAFTKLSILHTTTICYTESLYIVFLLMTVNRALQSTPVIIIKEFFV